MQYWLDESEGEIDFDRWGVFGKKGHLALSAHYLATAIDRQNGGAGVAITAKSIGDLSISYASPTGGAELDAYKSTPYGIDYLGFLPAVGSGAVGVGE